MLSALASLLGVIGIIGGHQFLSHGSAFGGVLFFLSLIGMSIVFWKN